MTARRLACAALSLVCVLAQGAAAQTAAEFAARAPVVCTLKPIRTIELSSQIAGVAKTVFVRPGQQVDLGTPLVQLDTDIAQVELEIARERAAQTASLDAARTRAQALKKRLDRLRRAYARRVVSALDFEQAQMDVALAEAELVQQEQQLALQQSLARRAEVTIEKSTILSPARGVIGEDIVQPGEQVGVTGSIGSLFVIEQLRAEAFVPLQLLPNVRTRSEMQLRIDGDDDNLVTARLDYISPVANLASNTISVYFVVEQDTVLSGSRCELKVGSQ